jgi:hypothetical protein
MTLMIRTTLTSLAAALALGTSAHAEEFALFVYETPADFAARDDTARGPGYWGAYAELAQAMGAAGIVRGGGPLTAPALGSRVAVRDGQSSVTSVDGSGEALSGWFVIDVADRAAAEAWAARVPAASTARIEVRAVLPTPMPMNP